MNRVPHCKGIFTHRTMQFTPGHTQKDWSFSSHLNLSVVVTGHFLVQGILKDVSLEVIPCPIEDTGIEHEGLRFMMKEIKIVYREFLSS
jgi:hypothetical protein